MRRKETISRIIVPLSILLIVLTGLNVTGINSNLTNEAGQAEYKIVSKWTWTGGEEGNIVDLLVDVGREVIYALLIEENGTSIQEIDLKTGHTINQVKINLIATYGHLRLMPTSLNAILIGEKNNVTIINIDVESAKYKIVNNLTIRDFRIRVVDAVEVSGYIVVAGAKAGLNGSLAFYIAMYEDNDKLWENTEYTQANGYFITVKPTSNGGICAAGIGGYACYTLSGSRIFSKSINASILAMDAPTTSSIIIAGINSTGTGFIALVNDGEIEWKIELGAFVPQSLTYRNGLIYATGETLLFVNNTVKHNLAVALLDTEGNVKVVGLEEANGTVLVPSIDMLAPTTVIIGGSIDSTPFIKNINIEKITVQTTESSPFQTTLDITETTTETGSPPTQGSNLQKVLAQYYISITLTIISSILLVITAFNLYRKRKK